MIGVLGYIAVGRALVDDRGTALLVAVVASAFTAGVPILGGLVGFVRGCMSFGAWYLEYKSNGSRPGGRSRGADPVSGGTSRTTARGDDTAEWGASWNDRPSSKAGGDADSTADDEWTTGFDDDSDRE